MFIYRDITEDFIKTPTVVAIGNFDGVHIGHQTVISKAMEIAQNEGLTPLVLTFEPHPRMFFKPDIKTLRLTTPKEKFVEINRLGIENIAALRFNKAMSEMSADNFVNDVLLQALKAKYIITGSDFVFGNNRSGDSKKLADMASKLNFCYLPVSQVLSNEGERISSSRVRALLQSGDVAEAAKMLGRNYTISGRVLHGDKRGRELGFPTANVSLTHTKFLPKNGVYQVLVSLKNQEQQHLIGVANLGTRPTIGGTKISLEVHIKNFDRDVYGCKITVGFINKIRDEMKFDSLSALKSQIERDVMG